MGWKTEEVAITGIHRVRLKLEKLNVMLSIS